MFSHHFFAHVSDIIQACNVVFEDANLQRMISIVYIDQRLCLVYLLDICSSCLVLISVAVAMVFTWNQNVMNANSLMLGFAFPRFRFSSVPYPLSPPSPSLPPPPPPPPPSSLPPPPAVWALYLNIIRICHDCTLHEQNTLTKCLYNGLTADLHMFIHKVRHQYELESIQLWFCNFAYAVFEFCLL